MKMRIQVHLLRSPVCRNQEGRNVQLAVTAQLGTLAEGGTTKTAKTPATAGCGKAIKIAVAVPWIYTGPAATSREI
jgi:hypothetical protein